jgi:pyruvate dehydrogenase (quinone)
MAKRIADIVVEALHSVGVKHCWGVPGDTLSLVTDAIRRSDQGRARRSRGRRMGTGGR